MMTKDFIFLEGWAKGRQYNQLSKALYVSQKLHDGQFRKDGNPYIVHPTAVTATAIRHGIDDEETLCIMQLHDVIEDCQVTCQDLSDYGFNNNIIRGVLTVSKITNVNFELYLKDILKDIKCTLTKIGDRAHNISTMCGGFSLEKQKQYVEETKLIIEFCKEARRLYPEYSNYILEMKKTIYDICDITTYFLDKLEEREKELKEYKEIIDYNKFIGEILK